MLKSQGTFVSTSLLSGMGADAVTNNAFTMGWGLMGRTQNTSQGALNIHVAPALEKNK